MDTSNTSKKKRLCSFPRSGHRLFVEDSSSSQPLWSLTAFAQSPVLVHVISGDGNLSKAEATHANKFSGSLPANTPKGYPQKHHVTHTAVEDLRRRALGTSFRERSRRAFLSAPSSQLQMQIEP